MKLILLCGAAALLCGAVLAGDNPAPQVGDKAPEFTLPGSDGKEYALKDFRGKRWVVLAWFPKAFTGG